jgi:hypothetical protein
MISNLISLLPIPLGIWFGICGGFPGLLLGLALIGLGLSNLSGIKGRNLND